jgi:ABC-2 type transport system permease protein
VGKNAPAATLIPGLISITILFSSSSIGPMVIPTERRVKTFERLVSAPISFYSIILGKTLGGFLFSLAIGVIPLFIGMVWFETQIVSLIALIAGLSLASYCFATLGIMFASFPTENPGDIMMLLNFVRLPLIFISGLYIPIESLPGWGQIAAAFSPLTYANDLVRYALEGKTLYGPVLDSVVLILFTAAFLFIGMRLDKKFRK